MDNDYLKKNIHQALTEGLAAMAIASPDDKVEYLGKYLLQYCERKTNKVKEDEKNRLIIEKAKEAALSEDLKAIAQLEQKAKDEAFVAKLHQFVETLPISVNSKQECMDTCANFVCDYLNIPAAYVAVKRDEGGTETLHYVSSNTSQKKVLFCKRLNKPVDEGEEAPIRQGVSFDAFKIPEIPEDPQQDDADEEPVQPKTNPQPSPLIIDNVMRDNRVKFFGVPKLGSYLAVPLTLESIDHEDGVKSASGDLNNGPYSKNPRTFPILFCADTIGKFRRFTAKDIEVIKLVAAKMVEVIQTFEQKMFDKHVAFLERQRTHNNPVQLGGGQFQPSVASNLIANAKAAEDHAAAQVSQELADQPDALDSLRTYKDLTARVLAMANILGNEPFHSHFRYIEDHVLPVPQIVPNLLFACGMALGMSTESMKDSAGHLTWASVKAKVIPEFTMVVRQFDPSEVKSVPRDISIAAIRLFCETTSVLEPGSYPGYFYVLPLVVTWLQKAIAAREAAIAYFKEAENKDIEIIV